MVSFFLEKLGSDGDCVATFSMAVIKHTAKRNLQKEEVIGAYGSRRTRVHHGGKAWQQAGVWAGARRGEFTSLTAEGTN